MWDTGDQGRKMDCRARLVKVAQSRAQRKEAGKVPHSSMSYTLGSGMDGEVGTDWGRMGQAEWGMAPWGQQ